jgi:hypothetical protein
MNLCFDEEMLSILTPEEIIFVSIYINDHRGNLLQDKYLGEFIESTAYVKLFDHFSYEMPYGIAKARTGDPDLWILSKLKGKYIGR